ncbi:family 78 glycoside hydrolase catalytic domain [Kineococcus sp. SYSU DK003]|uniref:family 78 glycoside hydrolase catalytic domain n=1 Tax=Kineococcus sp. SYSU DK003 TaxID=3383124 RepID=UPI003D7D67D1
MAQLAAPTTPRIEHRTDQDAVLGLAAAAPRLSWTVPAAPEGWRQTSCEVEISRAGEVTVHQVHTADQVLVPWPADPLSSREQARVRVRVSGADGVWSNWSPARTLEVGLLNSTDWTARFISPVGLGALHMPAPVLAGRLTVPGPVRSARLFATAHGIYVATLNGRPVDDSVLAPGWTSYENRLRYHTYDVTDLVAEGENRLEFLLGNGWYRGRLGYMLDRALYGDRLAVLAQLEVTTTDGAVHTLNSDGSWTARESQVVADDLYNGQRTDLRRGAAGVETATGTVEVLDLDVGTVVPTDLPVIRPLQTLAAQKVWTVARHAQVNHVVDFGQNAVGWIRLKVRGLPAGSEVIVRHAEVLEGDEIATVPLRSAEATDSWILAGPEEVVLEPRLTFHGFRYAEIRGVPDLRPEDVELVVLGTDLRRTGWFSSSHELLDRLHENVVWSTRGNFIDIPTDCPQRDERLGWTGDIQVFGPTASFLFDTAAFLGSWLVDLAAEQLPDGSVPHVVPDVNRNELAFTPAAAWGDAATIVPWTLYERTGDVGVLARQLPSMRAWVDKIAGLAGPDRLWAGGFQYGDWLDPTAPPEEAEKAMADPDVVATAHLARSAQIVAWAAEVLGLDDDAQKYAALAAEVREAFAEAYVSPQGRVHSDAQAVYALAIQWDLLPTAAQRQLAGRRLADLVRTNDFRIGTGFVGTPLVCDALAATGHADVAHRLLLQTQCPSWLYPVTMGATTIWERWDSLRPDGSINPGGMTSFNHYALGAVADWMHRSVAGLAPAEPGYRRLSIQPKPPVALTHAQARHLTPYGEAAVAWERADGEFRLSVTVPVGVQAEVHLPGAEEAMTVGHGEHHWRTPDRVTAAATDEPDWTRASIRDLLDDEEAWEQLAGAAVEAGIVPDAAAAASRLLKYLDSPAAQVGFAFVPDDRFQGASAVRQAATRILSA